MLKRNEKLDKTDPEINVVSSPMLTAGSTQYRCSNANETSNRDIHDKSLKTLRNDDLRIQRTINDISGPKTLQQISKEEMEEMIIDVLSTHLASVEYEPDLSRKKCPILSEIIENTIRRRYSGQHKIVSVVLIGALRDKGPEIAIQSRYSPQNDCFAFVYYHNKSLFAAAAVFAVLL